jgi:hypothetical protein
MEAVLFVHPGFLRREDVPLTISSSEIAGYGDYSAYIENLRRLYSVPAQRMVFVELEGRRLHSYHEGFEPEGSDILVEWSDFDFFPLERGVGGLEKGAGLAKKALHGFLAQKGIDKVVVAGEMGPYSRNVYGCVGAVCSLLRNHVPVRGVKGCVFPLVPYTRFVEDGFRAGHKDMQGLFGSGDGFFSGLEWILECLYYDAELIV